MSRTISFVKYFPLSNSSESIFRNIIRSEDPKYRCDYFKYTLDWFVYPHPDQWLYNKWILWYIFAYPDKMFLPACISLNPLVPSATFMGRSSCKFQGSFIMVKTEFVFFCFALVACTGKLQKNPVRLGHKYQPGINTRFWCFPPVLKPGWPV